RERSQRVSSSDCRACTATHASTPAAAISGLASDGRKSRLSAAIAPSFQPYSTGSYRQKCWWASTRIMTPTRTKKCNHENTKTRKTGKRLTTDLDVEQRHNGLNAELAKVAKEATAV